MLAWSNKKEVKIPTTLNNFSTNLVKTLEEFPSLKAIFMGVNLTQITHCSEKGRLPIITAKLIVVKRMQFYLWVILIHTTDSNGSNSVLFVTQFHPQYVTEQKKKNIHTSQTPTLFQLNDKDLILFSAFLTRGTQRSEKYFSS